MASPFGIFRKHGAVLTVVLTALCVFAFILADSLRPEHLPMLLAIGGFGLIGWIVGRGTGAAGWWVLGMAFVGFLVARMSPNLIGRGNVVQTAMGGLNAKEASQLTNQRQLANAFLRNVYERLTPAPQMMDVPSQGQGNPQLRQLIMQMNQQQAQRWEQGLRNVLFGNAFNDDPYTARQETARYFVAHEKAEEMGIEVTDEGVAEFLKKSFGKGLTQKVFRRAAKDVNASDEEILDAIAYNLQARTYFTLAYPRSNVSPLQAWKFYKQFAVTQSLEVAPIPVAAFLDEAPNPTDAELQAFFDQYKDRYPPGFVDPLYGYVTPTEAIDDEPAFGVRRRIQIAYFEADFAKFKPEVEEVTEEKIAKEYNSILEQNPLQLLNSRSTASRARSRRRFDGPAFAETAPGHGPQGGPAIAEAPRYQTLEQARDRISRDLEQRYEGVATSTALKAMNDAIEAALARMRELKDRYRLDTPEGAKSAQKASDELKTFAQDNNLRYVVLELMPAETLAVEGAYPVALAVEAEIQEYPSFDPELDSLWEIRAKRSAPVAMARLFRDISQLAYTPYQAVESRILQGLGPNQPPERAARAQGSLFAYWKIQDVEAAVPEFAEVKEEVARQWKLVKVRDAAKKRAEELAEKARAGQPQSLVDAFNEVTVTGSESGQDLSVRQTGTFSWREFVRQRGGATISELPELPKVGEEFMKTTFNELKPGEIGVAPNADKSVYYIAKVVTRSHTEEADWQALRESFLTPDPQAPQDQEWLTGVQQLSALTQQKMYSDWEEKFRKDHQIEVPRLQSDER